MRFQNTLIAQGIKFEPCPPYKHAMNGVIERAIYTVDCKARSILFEGSLPGEFWCYAIDHAVYIKNRAPTSTLPFGDVTLNSPITLWHAYTGKLPEFTRLAVLGCAANPLNTLEKHPKKMAFRHKPDYVFMGMEGNKIWKLLNIHTLTIEKYGDAAFNEYKFPLSNFKLPSDTTEVLIRPNIGSGNQRSRHNPQERAGGPDQDRAGGSDQNRAGGSGSVPTATGRAAGPSDQLGTSRGLESSGAGHSANSKTSAPVREAKDSSKRVFNETVA